MLHLGWFITFRPSTVFLAHVVGELPCGSQPTAPTCVVWSWRLIDGFALISASRGFEMLVYPVHYSNSFVTLVNHNRCETAVCVSPCLRVMAGHICEVARSWVGVCVPLALIFRYFQGNFRLCNRITFNLFFIAYCIS